jgi:uncharacterized protein (TIGR03546 family)
MVSSLFKFLRILSSDVEPIQISLGITLGMVAGLSPLVSVQCLLAVLLIIVLRVNVATFFVSYAVVGLIAYLADPLIASVGNNILSNESFKALFTDMYNNGFWRFMNFNNTVAMGSLLLSAVLALPLLLVSNFLIRKYRIGIEKHLKNSRLFKFVQNSKVLGKVISVTEKVN